MLNHPLRHVVAAGDDGEDGWAHGDVGSGMHGAREKNEVARPAAANGEPISGVLQLESTEISENGDHSFGFGDPDHGFSVEQLNAFRRDAERLGGRRAFAFTLVCSRDGER